MKRINHAQACSLHGACTKWAEEYFGRLRRAEIGHHIAGAYLLRYAQESAWRGQGSRADRVAAFAGLEVLRFWNNDVMRNGVGCQQLIAEAVAKRRALSFMK